MPEERFTSLCNRHHHHHHHHGWCWALRASPSARSSFRESASRHLWSLDVQFFARVAASIIQSLAADVLTCLDPISWWRFAIDLLALGHTSVFSCSGCWLAWKIPRLGRWQSLLSMALRSPCLAHRGVWSRIMSVRR